MALASRITVPLGMACYMGMMIGCEDNSLRAVRATRNLNDVAMEYIHGIEVIKVFGKAESCCRRYVQKRRQAASRKL